MNRNILVPISVLLLIITSSVLSLPRLAVENSTSCGSCHINPNGGGMRNEFGNYSTAFNELVLPQTKKYFQEFYRSPRLSESVQFGFDSRYLIIDDGRIFRMQTDLYFAMKPFNNFIYQIRIGEDPFGVTSVFENYALLYLENKKHYLKLGKFYPTYGLKIADHKSFIRERTGHRSNVYLDGMSVGTELEGFQISTELFNPNNHGVYGFNIVRYDNISDFGFISGISYRISEDKAGSFSGFNDARSFYGGISYDRFTFLSELDLVGESSDTLIFYSNLTVRLEYGLYFISEYNFFDGNRNLEDGTDENIRLSLEIFPIPFFELRPSYTHHFKGPYQGEDDFFLQFHVGY